MCWFKSSRGYPVNAQLADEQPVAHFFFAVLYWKVILTLVISPQEAQHVQNQ